MLPTSFLKTVSLFAGLGDDQLSGLQRCCGESVSLEAGARVFAEADLAESLYVVVGGRVALRFDLPGRDTDPARTLMSVEPGGVVGWSALVPLHRYTLSAYVVDGPCQLLRFRRAELLASLDRDPAVGYVVMKNLVGLVADRFLAFEHKAALALGRDALDGW
jgi:toluene monooxygenase system ferredoxin subunit